MKKSYLVLSISLLNSIFYSCTLKDETSSLINEDVKTVSVTISDMLSEDAQSRMSVKLETKMKYYWEANDTIGIFPNKGGQVEFPIEGIGGETTAKFDGGGWGLKNEASYSAYYPFNFYNRNAKTIPFSYLGQTQNGIGDLCREHLGKYAMMATSPITVTGTELDFRLEHVGSIIILHLTMPEATTYTSATLYTKSSVIPVKKTINLLDNELEQTSTQLSDRLTINLENVKTQTANEVISLWIAFPAVSETSNTLKVVVYDKNGLAYTSDVYKKDKITISDVVFKENTYYNRYASPILKEGFNFGLSDWGSDGMDHGGSVY